MDNVDPVGAAGFVIEQIKNLYKLGVKLQTKWDCYKDLTSILETLKSKLSVGQDQLENFLRSYELAINVIGEDLKQSYNLVINSHIDKLSEISKYLEERDEMMSKMTSRKNSWLSSVSNAKIYAYADETSVKISKFLGELSSLLREAHEEIKSLDEKRDDQFKPYDHKSNIGSAILTMDDVMTPEGKLKRGVLTGRDGTAVLGSYPPSDLSSSGRDGTTSVEGLGGIGKTTALEGLAIDEDVKKRFSDGVYFMKFGKEANEMTLKENFCMIVRKSGGTKLSEKIRNISVQEIIDETIKWFTNKKVLFICDDLWPTSSNTLGMITELKQLGKCSSECHIVLSTRYGQIASHAWMNSGIVVKFTALKATGKRSRDVFIKNAILSKADIHQLALDEFTSIQEILKKCAGIYLALAVAGGLLWHYKANERSLDKAVKRLDSMLMSRMESLLDEDKLRKNSTLYCCFNESLECVNDCAEKLGHGTFWSTTIPRLCVFKKGTLMTWEMMNSLWGAESDEANISYVVKKLEEFHLIEAVNNGEAYKFHDLFHDFCIRKVGGKRKVPKLHREFLDNVAERCGVLNLGQSSAERICGRSWWTLKDVGGIEMYMRSNLARHLKEAGKVDQLEALMTRFEWTLLRFKKNDYNEMMNDLSIWLSEEEKKLKDANEDRSKYIKKRQMRQAISSAWSKSDNEKELACEILSHLLDNREASEAVRSYIASVESIGMKGWLRPLQQVWEVPSADVINVQFVIKDISVNWMRNQAIVVGDGQIRLLNLSTLGVRELFLNISGIVTCVAWSKSGNTVILGSEGEIMKCNVDEESVATICIFEGAVRSADISDDGGRVVFCSIERNCNCIVRVWDVEKVKELHVFKDHEQTVSSVAISGDGSRVVYGSLDRTVRVWDVEKGKEICFKDHSNWVSSVAISRDGSRVVSVSFDDSVRVWDVEKGEELRVLKGHKQNVRSVAISADGSRVVSGSEDTTVRVWSVDKGEEYCFEGHSSWVANVAISMDGCGVVSGSCDKTVRVWDAEKGSEYIFAKNIPLFKGHLNSVSSVAISRRGNRVVAGSRDKTVRVWDAEKRSELCVFEGHKGRVNIVAISRDGCRVVSNSLDRTIRVWDVEKKLGMCALDNHGDTVSCLAISADGSRVVSGSEERNVRVWDAEKGSKLCLFEGHDRSVLSVSISGDGNRVVSGSWDGSVYVWDVEKGKKFCALEGPKRSFLNVAMSEDGSRIVSGDSRGFSVWDTVKGSKLCVISHDFMEGRIAMSENGNFVACLDDRLLIWKVKDNAYGDKPKYVSLPKLCFLESYDVCFIGQRIVIGFGDGRILQYDMIE